MEIGSKVGRYEIVSPVGKGGMGEVWCATDTSLGREVALKVLPEAFAGDAERRARFEREAKLLASLNHPNIATLYGLEEIDGEHLLVMEFIEGVDLAERIARGPIPWAEARAIAAQMAHALEAAHEHGVIHRDLKPANVKLRPDGTIKVLDFGLAKAQEPVDSGVDLTHSPTLTGRATAGGAILGTVGYMSPEQARGQPVGRQTDIWAFGCMFYEMITDRRLFDGDTASDVLAGVLRSEIDLEALPTDIPPALHRLLRRCLQRDLSRRLHDFGDVILELEEEEEPEPGAPGEVTPSAAGRMGWAVAAVATAAAAALVWMLSSSGSRDVVIRTEIARPGTAEFRFQGDVGSPPVVAPDGSAIVFGASAPGNRSPSGCARCAPGRRASSRAPRAASRPSGHRTHGRSRSSTFRTSSGWISTPVRPSTSVPPAVSPAAGRGPKTTPSSSRPTSTPRSLGSRRPGAKQRS